MSSSFNLASIAAFVPSATVIAAQLATTQPNPHTGAPSELFAARTPAVSTPRGAVDCGNITQLTVYDHGPEGYGAAFQIDAVDLDGDGYIRADAGFYDLYDGPNEIRDLSVTFRIEGQIQSTWQCVLDGEILYPFLFFEWDLTEENPRVWDLGSDPGVFFFSGAPVTQAPGIYFFDTENDVVGEIGPYEGRLSFTAVAENVTQGICYTDIQSALDDSSPGDEIVVEPGTYDEQLQWPLYDIELRSSDGAAATIFDAFGIGTPVVNFPDTVSRSSVFEGFTITGAGGYEAPLVARGSPTIRDCIVASNNTEQGGGADVYGSPLFDRVTFRYNVSNFAGGAVSDFSNGESVYQNCVFDSNDAFFSGGAMYFGGASHRVINCTFANNFVFDEAGPAIYITNFPPAMNMEILNSIFSGNERNGDASQAISSAVPGLPLIQYSITQADFGGTNTQADPLFIDPDTHDWRLQAGSPAIDAGNNAAVPAGVQTDVEGLPRFVDDPNTPDSGNGAAPVVDIGAHEYQPAGLPRCAADFADPMGELNFFDVLAFLVAFEAENDEADLAPPFGLLDFDDVQGFLRLFADGCPL